MARQKSIISDKVSLFAVDDVPYRLFTKTEFRNTNETIMCLVPALHMKVSSAKKSKIDLSGKYGNYEKNFKDYMDNGNIAMSMYITNSKNMRNDYYKRESVKSCLSRLDGKFTDDRYDTSAIDGPFRSCKDITKGRFPNNFIGSNETPANFYKVIDHVGKVARAVFNNRLEKLKVPMKNTTTIDISDFKNKEETKQMRKILRAMQEVSIPYSAFNLDKEIDVRFNLKDKYYKLVKNW